MYVRKSGHEYKQALDSLVQKLEIRRYSSSTVTTYRYMFREFLKSVYPMPLHKVSKEDILYFQQMLVKRGVSASYQNQSINALKFYLEQVLGHDRELYELERPQKERKLPTVLSQEEVSRVLGQIKNLKHRAIIMTIYSCGLRISELLNLQIRDIDSDRMEVFIRGGKGKKDRLTLLSPHLLELLRVYFRAYQPSEYLFEGQKGGRYSTSSIRKILERAVGRADIRKHVVTHTLRHSFGTHLLEHGTNLRYIQVLMGHESPKTTEIYTHVAQSDIHKIMSPLDHLADKGYI